MLTLVLVKILLILLENIFDANECTHTNTQFHAPLTANRAVVSSHLYLRAASKIAHPTPVNHFIFILKFYRQHFHLKILWTTFAYK